MDRKSEVGEKRIIADNTDNFFPRMLSKALSLLVRTPKKTNFKLCYLDCFFSHNVVFEARPWYHILEHTGLANRGLLMNSLPHNITILCTKDK